MLVEHFFMGRGGGGNTIFFKIGQVPNIYLFKYKALFSCVRA